MVPAGAVMLSPWLIQTWVPAWMPVKSGPGTWMLSRCARPYSRTLLRSTGAPARLASNWAP